VGEDTAPGDARRAKRPANLAQRHVAVSVGGGVADVTLGHVWSVVIADAKRDGKGASGQDRARNARGPDGGLIQRDTPGEGLSQLLPGEDGITHHDLPASRGGGAPGRVEVARAQFEGGAGDTAPGAVELAIDNLAGRAKQQ